ncbi:hypothetical protein MNBD_BACTEROID03-1871 [hydrothermal vent metagenome]|uniref:Uncharacterized protein n=1 Tax=hydrothermal vent metagenome TaxID=652676 RepID=A0A3B0TSB7_9ZZZZ
MYYKIYVSVLLLLFVFYGGNAQDCTLNIGGENTKTLISVFQLNKAQINQMQAWSAELQIETKGLEDAIEKLFAEHPQSTQEELATLADKYKAIQQKIVNASKNADKNLLSVFNERQYDRYLALCYDAIRTPIEINTTVVPDIQKDSVVDPE